MQFNVSRDYRSAALAAVFVALLSTAVLAQAPDPHIGVWKLNPAKSKFDPAPGPRGGTATWEVVASGTKVTTDAITADGTPRHWESITNYDGKARFTRLPNYSKHPLNFDISFGERKTGVFMDPDEKCQADFQAVLPDKKNATTTPPAPPSEEKQ